MGIVNWRWCKIKSRLEVVNSKALIEYKVNGKKHRCPLSTEFLKGHLWLFTIYFVLYLHFTIYHFQSTFLPYTTFNLLFLVLLFTISNHTFIFTFYHFQFNITCTIYRLCFTIYHFQSTCTFIYFIIMFYTFYYPKFNKLLYTILVLLYTTSLLFFTVTSHLHFLQPKL